MHIIGLCDWDLLALLVPSRIQSPGHFLPSILNTGSSHTSASNAANLRIIKSLQTLRSTEKALFHPPNIQLWVR